MRGKELPLNRRGIEAAQSETKPGRFGSRTLGLSSYSLPLTDFRPRILLQLAGLARDRKPRFRIVDPLAETLRDRYARFISYPVETVATDWREWFQGAVANG